MEKKKFYIQNLGCKVNAFEAESVAGSLTERGYERTFAEAEAEIGVVFTCAVTNTAAQKSRQMIRRMKRAHPGMIVAAAGCYTQIAPEMIKEAEIVVGTRYKSLVPEFIAKYIETGEKICAVEELPDQLSFEPMVLDHFESRTRAYLKIQDGCNQFCSYCVIPYARGRERSMDPKMAVREIKKLAESHPEIVLSGIHTGRYGKEYNRNLAELMADMLKELPEDIRIRISSIEMTEVSDELIDLMERDHRVARHLHIPLQSGCDATLKRMNRPYTTAEYLRRINEIRSRIPDISISTDLIVGFAGESEAEFKETEAFLKECAFSFLHVFPFSVRNGTAAEKMPDHPDPQVKKERVHICTELSRDMYDTYKKAWIGKPCEVLVETCEDGYSFGHTSEYVPVYIKGEKDRGTFVRVVPDELREHNLYCRGDD